MGKRIRRKIMNQRNLGRRRIGMEMNTQGEARNNVNSIRLGKSVGFVEVSAIMRGSAQRKERGREQAQEVSLEAKVEEVRLEARVQAQEARREAHQDVKVQEESLVAKVQVQGVRARREDVSHVEAHTIRQTLQRIRVE